MGQLELLDSGTMRTIGQSEGTARYEQKDGRKQKETYHSLQENHHKSCAQIRQHEGTKG